MDGDEPVPETFAVPLEGAAESDQVREFESESASVALTWLVVQFEGSSSETLKLIGPVPWVISGAEGAPVEEI